MNTHLTSEIIKHVFHCLGVKHQTTNNKINSIMQPNYQLATGLSFEDNTVNPIWGVQLKIEDEIPVAILLSDCSQDNLKEFAMVIMVKDTPSYGCYYSYDDLSSPPIIACSIEQKSWAICSTYLQATFLAGMEKIREFNNNFNKLQDEQVCQVLFDFIDFCNEELEKIEG